MSNFEDEEYSLDEYNYIEPKKFKLKQDSLGWVRGKLVKIKNILNSPIVFCFVLECAGDKLLEINVTTKPSSNNTIEMFTRLNILSKEEATHYSKNWNNDLEMTSRIDDKVMTKVMKAHRIGYKNPIVIKTKVKSKWSNQYPKIIINSLELI